MKRAEMYETIKEMRKLGVAAFDLTECGDTLHVVFSKDQPAVSVGAKEPEEWKPVLSVARGCEPLKIIDGVVRVIGRPEDFRLSHVDTGKLEIIAVDPETHQRHYVLGPVGKPDDSTGNEPG